MIIGITGGIACGKSTVSNYLTLKGYFVSDADLIVRKLWEKDSFRLLLEKELKITLPKNNYKKYVSNLIFNDSDKRQKINNLIHPLVKKEMIKEVNASPAICR